MIDIEPNADPPAELTDADLDAAAGAASGLSTGKRQHKPFTAAPSPDSSTIVGASQTITFTGLE